MEASCFIFTTAILICPLLTSNGALLANSDLIVFGAPPRHAPWVPDTPSSWLFLGTCPGLRARVSACLGTGSRPAKPSFLCPPQPVPSLLPTRSLLGKSYSGSQALLVLGPGQLLASFCPYPPRPGALHPVDSMLARSRDPTPSLPPHALCPDQTLMSCLTYRPTLPATSSSICCALRIDPNSPRGYPPPPFSTLR